MTKITYAPDGEVAQTWDFDPKRLMMAELEAIEKVTGLTFIEFGEGLNKGSAKAMRALVWILRKRHGEPTLRYSEVDFALGDLTTDDDEEQPDDEPEGEALSLVPKEESLTDASE